ncbi:SMI1/KNR4 family protein [Fortiea sp. LEGE XX443]|uniref:SMI1/KNR4 family protein n=1 Tax=Fortiea sp. LEGE XX443 TaxID=1828611 RepID=UPI00187E70A8|nr:SMI1/KNR4 family protein [Fortiea sp. LEGE XX443]MBE9006120.1 SMI1/KNR4 family protein [Fortiea sp. LEGE XX443]
MYTWLPKKVEQAQQVLKARNVKLGFKFNSPANQGEIQRCEEELGFILPDSYKEFLKFSNGANLFCNDEPRVEITLPWFADSGILIQSTSTIVAFNQNQDKVYVEDNGEKKYIAFCYLGYLATGDFCSFDVTTNVDSEYKVLDCQHDFSFKDWQAEHVIANSFEDWLIKIFDEVIYNNNRPEYWIPSPLQKEFSL